MAKKKNDIPRTGSIEEICKAIQEKMILCHKHLCKPHVYIVFKDNESNEVMGYKCICLKCHPNPTPGILASLPLYKTPQEMIKAWYEQNKFYLS